MPFKILTRIQLLPLRVLILKKLQPMKYKKNLVEDALKKEATWTEVRNKGRPTKQEAGKKVKALKKNVGKKLVT